MSKPREMITDPNVYFDKGCGRCDNFDTPKCVVNTWGEELAQLRDICLTLGLAETAKWGHPCYTYAGRNIALIGALRAEIRFSFMNPTLLSDMAGVLVANGPNTATKGVLKLTSCAEVQHHEETIRNYLGQLKDHAERGTTPPKVSMEFDWPDELAEALDADPALADAFHALTPGRQKSYLINLNGAKHSETRIRRIEKFRDKILAGKGAMER